MTWDVFWIYSFLNLIAGGAMCITPDRLDTRAVAAALHYRKVACAEAACRRAASSCRGEGCAPGAAGPTTPSARGPSALRPASIRALPCRRWEEASHL
jgi:hypothetical protein